MKTISYILLISILLFTSCNTTTKEENEIMKKGTKNHSERPLETVLNQKKVNFETKASDHKKKIYAEGIQSVVDHRVVENALQVGDRATNFTLTNALKEEISLYNELEKGPVIVTWYRGGWCPYCNLALQYMQASLPEYKKHGASLFALTPESPNNSISTKEKNDLQFQVLSDVDNVIAKQYKVLFTLTDEVNEAYENGFGLSKFNGNKKGELPLAATYIIGQDRIIKYAFLDADYRNRAEPKDILNVLSEL